MRRASVTSIDASTDVPSSVAPPSPAVTNGFAVDPLASVARRGYAGRLCVVLPSYNEAENLPVLLDRIRQVMDQADFAYEVMVVNDGSSDDTAKVASEKSESMPIELVNHSVNQGLGRTLLTGLRTAIDRADPLDIIVTMDADNTQPPESIPDMVRAIERGYELVVASRFVDGAQVVGVPFHRVLLSHAGRLAFSMFHPIAGIRDYTCGFRAYRADLLRRGFAEFGDRFITESGFAAMSDLLIKLRRLKPQACEIPLRLRYDHKRGASKMKVVRTTFKTLGMIVRRRFSR